MKTRFLILVVLLAFCVTAPAKTIWLKAYACQDIYKDHKSDWKKCTMNIGLDFDNDVIISFSGGNKYTYHIVKSEEYEPMQFECTVIDDKNHTMLIFVGFKDTDCFVGFQYSSQYMCMYATLVDQLIE